MCRAAPRTHSVQQLAGRVSTSANLAPWISTELAH
jgi:hypothetical protein